MYKEHWHFDIIFNPFPRTWTIAIDTTRHWFKGLYIGPLLRYYVGVPVVNVGCTVNTPETVMHSFMGFGTTYTIRNAYRSSEYYHFITHTSLAVLSLIRKRPEAKDYFLWAFKLVDDHKMIKQIEAL